MKKILFATLFLTIGYSINAQNKVGVNTSTPQKELHVNGSVQITNDLNVGGTATTTGNSGNKGQVLVSNGPNQAPTWKNFEEVAILPIIVDLSNSTIPTTYLTAATRTVYFDQQIIQKTDYISYNNLTGEFTILKKGYYRLYANARLSIDDIPGSVTAGESRTELLKNNQSFLAKSTYNHERTVNVIHTLSGMEYFDVNDKIKLQVYRSVNHRISNANISILYTGK